MDIVQLERPQHDICIDNPFDAATARSTALNDRALSPGPLENNWHIRPPCIDISWAKIGPRAIESLQSNSALLRVLSSTMNCAVDDTTVSRNVEARMASFLRLSPLMITRLVWRDMMPARMLKIVVSMPISDVEECFRGEIRPLISFAKQQDRSSTAKHLVSRQCLYHVMQRRSSILC